MRAFHRVLIVLVFSLRVIALADGPLSQVDALRDLSSDQIGSVLIQLSIAPIREDSDSVIDALMFRIQKTDNIELRKRANHTLLSIAAKLNRDLGPARQKNLKELEHLMPFSPAKTQELLDLTVMFLLSEVEKGKVVDESFSRFGVSAEQKNKLVSLIDSKNRILRRVSTSLLEHMRIPWRLVQKDIDLLTERFQVERDEFALTNIANILVGHGHPNAKQIEIARRYMTGVEVDLSTRMASVKLLQRSDAAVVKSVDDLMLASLEEGMNEVVLPVLAVLAPKNPKVLKLFTDIFDESPNELKYLAKALLYAPELALLPEIASRMDRALRNKETNEEIRRTLLLVSLVRETVDEDLLPRFFDLVIIPDAPYTSHATALIVRSLQAGKRSPEILKRAIEEISFSEDSNLVVNLAQILAAIKKEAASEVAKKFLMAADNNRVVNTSVPTDEELAIIRWAAVASVIGDLGESSVTVLLERVREGLNWHNGSNIALRNATIRILGRSVAADSPILVSLSKDTNDRMRGIAAQAYGWMGRLALPELDRLKAWLQTEQTPFVRAHLIRSLGQMGSQTVSSLLESTNRSAYDRKSAVAVLGNPSLNSPEVEERLKQEFSDAVEDLSNTSSNSHPEYEDAEQRVDSALNALWTTSERGKIFVTRWATDFNDPSLFWARSFSQQRAATYLLADTEVHPIFPLDILERLLTSAVAVPRNFGARISHLWGTRAVPLLIKALEFENSQGASREMIEALSRFGSGANPTIPSLMKIAGHPDPYSPRQAAADLLVKLRPFSDEGINTSLRSEDPRLRAGAVRVLSTVSGQDHRIPKLLMGRLEQEADPVVRRNIFEGMIVGGPDGWSQLIENFKTRKENDRVFLEATECLYDLSLKEPKLDEHFVSKFLEVVFERGGSDSKKFMRFKELDKKIKSTAVQIR